MSDLDPTWTYALLAHIGQDGSVINQRPLPTHTFEEIVQASGDAPFAVAHRAGHFYLFNVTHVNLGVPISPAEWEIFPTKDEAIACGLEIVRSSLLTVIRV